MTLEALQQEWREKYRTHTDLALEAREVVVEREGPPEIPGVAVETEETEYGDISRVVIMNEVGARAMGKMPGRYSTIEAPALRERDRDVLEKIAELIGAELQRFLAHMQIPAEGDVLVIGLGNWNSTPDALGPRTVHHLVVTRHFYHMATPDGRRGVRPVAALSPGVLGITGIETAEIVAGLVRQVKPALVVCVDALAARNTDRLATTIQIADAGIQPGSGVGNKRFGITRESLGVPVIAIGVPTVVHALTVVADGLEKLGENGAATRGQTGAGVGVGPGVQAGAGIGYGGAVAKDPAEGWPLPDPNLILRHGVPPAGPGTGLSPGQPSGPGPMQATAHAPGQASAPPPPGAQPFGSGQPVAGAASAGRPLPQSPMGGSGAPGPGAIPPVRREVLQDLLEPYMGDLIMTPKEIDVLIEDVAETVAEALNIGLHEDLDFNRLILSAIRA